MLILRDKNSVLILCIIVVAIFFVQGSSNAPINCKPPAPPMGDHGGFDRFALPGVGEFDHKVDYGGGAH